MLKALTLTLVAALLFSQAPAAKKDEQPEAYSDADAYEIYSAILPSEWPMSAAHAKELVIDSSTKNNKMCLSPDRESEALLRPAISDYVKKNDKTWILQPTFSLGVPYRLIAADELKSIFESGGWQSFRGLHPDSGGWIELSAVGFNADKTVAVVYKGHHCGMLCGGGDFHVLEKKDGKWSPLKWKGSSCGWRS
jgi:hypothetical protein